MPLSAYSEQCGCGGGINARRYWQLHHWRTTHVCAADRKELTSETDTDTQVAEPHPVGFVRNPDEVDDPDDRLSP